MKPRYLIACEIIRHEIEYLQKALKLELEVNFLRKGFHQNPDTLRRELQIAIDAAGDDYEYILLGYGLCGKGMEGICARRTPLVVPRVHDCISLLLGSAKRYDELFATHPGTYYYSPGWVEWGHDAVERTPAQGFGLDRTFEEYAALFGEDNARYLMELEQSWKNNYTRAAYINSDLPDLNNWEKKAREIAAASGWQFEQVAGSLNLLGKLLEGPWEPEEFLVVPPGATIAASYDGQIMTSGAG